jgi:O-antigen/teichoic acid export membrane protein
VARRPAPGEGSPVANYTSREPSVDEPLLSGRVLARGAAWSFGGIFIPAIVGIAAMPTIVHGLGDERFGVLALAWAVVGYFGLFDLGLGRAVTRRASELMALRDEDRLRTAVWTSWYLMLVLGLGAAALALVVTHALQDRVIPVSPALRRETLVSFSVLALGVPVVVLTTGVRGVLEAAQRFGLVNAVRIPMGLLTFAVPVVSLRFTPELPPVILGLVLVRLAGLLAYALMAVRVVPALSRLASFQRRAARELLASGAWMTVSNVVSPVMVTFDRFFVSALVSVAAVTYYATPYEAVSQALHIPGALSSVLFPAFSAAFVTDRQRLAALFRGGVRTMFLVQVPLTFVVVCFAPEILRAWLGPAFETRSTPVLRWLMLGVLINSLGFLPANFLHGANRADLTAKLHVLELPIYVTALTLLIANFGIAGAAIAWCGRVTVDALVLYWLAARVEGSRVRELLPPLGPPAALFLLVIASPLASTAFAKATVAAAFAATFAAVLWWWGLHARYRTLALRLTVQRAVRREAGES